MSKLFVIERVNSFQKEEKKKIINFTTKKEIEREDYSFLKLRDNLNITSSFPSTTTNSSVDSKKFSLNLSSQESSLFNLNVSSSSSTNLSEKNQFLGKKIQFNFEKINNNSENLEIISSEQLKNSINTETVKSELFIINDSINIKKKRKNKENNLLLNEGRWSFEENAKFIEALVEYGKNWKEIQKYIITRSTPQTRSHAQKFLLKLKSIKNSDLNIDLTSNRIKTLMDVIDLIKSKNENKENEKQFVINTLINLSEAISREINTHKKKNNSNSKITNKHQIILKKNESIKKKTEISNNITLNEEIKIEQDKIEINTKFNITKNNKSKTDDICKENSLNEIKSNQLSEEKEIKLIKDDSWILNDVPQNKKLIFECGFAYYVNDFEFPFYNNSIRNIKENYYNRIFENSSINNNYFFS